MAARFRAARGLEAGQGTMKAAQGVDSSCCVGWGRPKIAHTCLVSIPAKGKLSQPEQTHATSCTCPQILKSPGQPLVREMLPQAWAGGGYSMNKIQIFFLKNLLHWYNIDIISPSPLQVLLCSPTPFKI